MSILNNNLNVIFMAILHIFNNYCVYYGIIILSFIASVIIIIIGVKRKINYLNLVLKEMIQTIFIVMIGMIFLLFGINISLKNEDTLKLIFIVFILSIFVIFLIECVLYKKTIKDVIKHNLNRLNYILKMNLFLLTLTSKVEIIDLICLSYYIISIDIAIQLLNDNRFSNKTMMKKRKDNDSIFEEDELFDSRKKELMIIEDELISNFDNYNSIIISGNWGSGKTSLVNVLKGRLSKKYEIIDIQCGVECDLKSMLENIALQIERILDNHGIYTNENDIVHKYFEEVGHLAADMDYKHVSHILRIIDKHPKSFTSLKEELNNKMALLKTNVYIFIDDLDRILDKESRINILKVIYETINLQNCLSIFTVDQDKFLGDEKKSTYLEYIEKYVDFSFRLANITFDEIINSYEEKYFSKEFIEGLNYNLKKKNIVQTIKNNYKSISEELNKEKDLLNFNMLKKFENNPRKIKKLLQLIHAMIDVVNKGWFSDKYYQNNEYTCMDWIDKITRVSILNIFYKDCFDRLYFSNDLKIYSIDENTKKILFIILKDFDNKNKSKEIDLYNMLILELYTMNARMNKTNHQRIIEELETKNIDLMHINDYLYECLIMNINYKWLDNILSYIENNPQKISYLSLIVGQYMKVSHSLYYLEHPDCVKISNRVCQTLMALEKNGKISNNNAKNYMIYLNNMIDEYYKRRFDLLNDVVKILENTNEKVYCLNDIILKILKIYNGDYETKNRKLLNWISDIKNQINNINGDALFFKFDYIYILDTLSRMIHMIDNWYDLLLQLKNENEIAILLKNDYASVIEYCKKVICNINQSNKIDENMIDEYSSYLESVDYNKYSEVEKKNLAENVYLVYSLLEEKGVYKVMGKMNWHDKKEKIYNKIIKYKYS